jgi:DNA-binding CsgD family transcriptional regulator
MPSSQHDDEATRQAVEDEATRLLASLPRTHIDTFVPTIGRLTTEMVREIQQTVPAYAQPLEGHFGAMMAAGVEQAVRRMVDSVGVDVGPDRRWADLYRKIGRAEFLAGRSLDSLQTAYRVGGRVAWRHIADWGMRQRLPMAALTLLAEAIFAYIDEISRLSIEGFTQAQSESARVTERRQRKLIEVMLADPPAPAEVLGTLATQAGWPLPDRVAAVAIEPADDPQAASLPDLPAEVLMDLDGDTPCLLTAKPEEHLEQLAEHLNGRRACVGPTVRLREAAMSLRLARRGLELMVRDIIPERPIARCDDHLSVLCVLGDEFLIARLLHDALAPLSSLTVKQRERTAQTMLAWLESRGSVPEIARTLGIHPQTVRYRMRQVDELFGDQLDDPDRRLDLEIALRTRRFIEPAGV